MVANLYVRTLWIAIATALNEGLKLVRGDVVAFQDADDVFFRDHFAVCADSFERNPSSGMYSRCL